MGPLKVPQLGISSGRLLRYVAPIFVVVLVAAFFPVWPKKQEQPSINDERPVSDIRVDEEQVSDFRVIVPQSNTKIYLNRAPKEMIEEVAVLTGLQAARFIEQSYSGKWMRFTAPITDVMSYRVGHTRLIFRPEGATTRVELLETEYEKVAHLRAGDVVTVEGAFKDMDRHGPEFDKGTVIAVNPNDN